MSLAGRPLGSTYRVQLNGFGLRATANLVGYLRGLGVETLYLSPIATATPGSSHGYDVIDPTRLDPALGTPEDLEALLQKVDSHGMRVLLDIVPNHMSTSSDNVWWTDVLRHGQGSEYARFFDIDWGAGGGRVLLPILARPFGEVLESGELQVRAAASGELFVWYGNRPLPLSPKSTVASGSHQLLDLLDAQHYRLAYWKVAPYEIDYRRFFDINDLVGIRVEDPEVYRKTHTLTARLADDPRVAGVRVDHVDGLADPEAYLRRLHRDLSDSRIVLVEKVLARGEELPDSWVSDGTTGYEFADLAFAVFTDPTGTANISGLPYDFHSEVIASRGEALDRLFPGQLDRLAHLVDHVAAQMLKGRDIPVAAFRNALHALTSCLSVYRTYTTAENRNDADNGRIDDAVTEAREHLEDELSLRALSVLHDLLLGLPLDDEQPGASSGARTQLCVRWQQLSSAVAAKGVEDTALYRFPGLQSAADVGSDPGEPAISVDEFHKAMERRSVCGSASLNTTSTHDSKRSEDSRCRLAALSEIPARWTAVVEELRRSNNVLAVMAFASEGVPTETESSLYQTIVSIWPSAGEWDDGHTKRVVDYCIKAAREAKSHTSWTEPDEAFEEGLSEFASGVLDSARSRGALGRIVKEIGAAGAVNSLSLVVLKTVAPGVPDFYQGTEAWRNLLVDPDNRRPVDYATLRRIVSTLPQAGAKTARQLLASWEDGSIKAFVIREALRARRDSPQLFAEGDYQPVEVRGTHRDHIVAFIRQFGDESALAVVPRFTIGLSNKPFPLGEDWMETELRLPVGVAPKFRDAFTGDLLDCGLTIPVSDVFATLPVALLLSA
jgi:(1->4)-alpha-D-glucan 1-alpha-D-glucosylmutase